MVSDYATKASFYLNNILIGTVTSTQFNLPYLITAYGDGLGGYDPQFTFVGSEIRNRQTESTSIRIYDMKYYQINGTNKTTVDFFPQGFDPNILVPIQTELESRIHFAETPVSDDLTNVKFKHSPIVPDINNKNTYWVVYPHPNTEINNSTDITAFMNIQLKDFLKQEK